MASSSSTRSSPWGLRASSTQQTGWKLLSSILIIESSPSSTNTGRTMFPTLYSSLNLIAQPTTCMISTSPVSGSINQRSITVIPFSALFIMASCSRPIRSLKVCVTGHPFQRLQKFGTDIFFI